MAVEIDAVVTIPGYKPYPRYGRVTRAVDADHVLLTQVQCGDPRCAAEHLHGEVVCCTADLEGVQAYQPRASWELGRKSSPNAVMAPA